MLANTLPYMPDDCVHLAVVDPGVGGIRRESRSRTSPDGCSSARTTACSCRRRLARRPGPRARAREPRVRAAVRLAHVPRPRPLRAGRGPSRARRAARGARPAARSGRARPPDLPEPDVGASRIRATVLYVDRFGNMQLNLTREHLEVVGIVPGTRVELCIGTERYYAVAARTFSDARPGDIILYEDAYRRIAIAISRGERGPRCSRPCPARSCASTSTSRERGTALRAARHRAVVRQPALWALLRRPVRRQFDRLAPSWAARFGARGLPHLEPALDSIDRGAAADSRPRYGDGRRRVRGRAALARRGGRGRRPLAADGRRGPQPDAAGARRTRSVRRGRRCRPTVRRRVVRPRRAREHDPVLRRARAGHRAGRPDRLRLLGRRGDADLRAVGAPSLPSSRGAASRISPSLRPDRAPRWLPAAPSRRKVLCERAFAARYHRSGRPLLWDRSPWKPQSSPSSRPSFPIW